MSDKTWAEVQAEALGYGINSLSIGQRVELHPATDLWMRGARYGEIIGFVARTLKQQKQGDAVVYRVRLDKHATSTRVLSTNLRPILQGIR